MVVTVIMDKGVVVKWDTIFYKLTDEYVEFDIRTYPDYKHLWHVEEELENKSTDFKNFKVVTLELVDKNNNLLMFYDPIDFVNFMSKNGYCMIDKKESLYFTKISFKKK
jgi:hypothetical protein